METPVNISKFGRYKILDILGRGLISTVFRARNPLSNIVIAINPIHPQISTVPMFAQHFEREGTTFDLNRPKNVSKSLSRYSSNNSKKENQNEMYSM